MNDIAEYQRITSLWSGAAAAVNAHVEATAAFSTPPVMFFNSRESAGEERA